MSHPKVPRLLVSWVLQYCSFCFFGLGMDFILPKPRENKKNKKQKHKSTPQGSKIVGFMGLAILFFLVCFFGLMGLAILFFF